MFFVDKYSPKTIDDVQFHKNELDILKKMSQDESIPHIIFYGPEGSGKKTLLKLFMEMLYDKQVNNLIESPYKVTGSGNSITDVIIKQSNYHIVIEPNNNNFDRYLIQDVVKEYAKKVPLGIFTSKKSFKTVLINSIDNLSYYAQTSLRRTMEKFSGNCRFIMWCRSLSKVIDPLRSRCYCFRITSPSEEMLLELLLTVCFNENIKITFKETTKIIRKANGNIKKLLWMLQLKKINESYITTYDKTIYTIVKLILTADIEKIIEIRDYIYNIMTTNIPGTQIIKDIVNFLLKNININFKTKINIVEISAKTEHNLIRGRREIIHLEAFITAVMYELFHEYQKKDLLKASSQSV